MTVIVDARPEVLHLRTRFHIPAFSLKDQPVVFDRNSQRNAGLGARTSSEHFDRAFGGKRESRCANEALIHHVMDPTANDTALRQLFGCPQDSTVGLCQFLWALDYCERPDGKDFLPPFGGSGIVRLIAYIKGVHGHPMVAEAIRTQTGFDLITHELDEVDGWADRTFLLSLTNP